MFKSNRSLDINSGVKAFAETPGSVLLDVRTPEEYAAGHIEGSLNIPLQSLNVILDVISDKDTVIYVYCRSGNRSGQSLSILSDLGFTNVTNIGGIIDYKGLIVKESTQ